MNLVLIWLPVLLRAAAVGQFCVALLNFRLVHLMGWKPDLDRLPLLVREVFHVHKWFISITLAIFAIFTWRFAGEMAVTPACRWLAGEIAAFWAIRTVIQFSYYSGTHWHGKAGQTAIHFLLLFAYGGLVVVYAAACLGGFGG
jgi:hypothetical protein